MPPINPASPTPVTIRAMNGFANEEAITIDRGFIIVVPWTCARQFREGHC
jgi:hypothetical protein